MNKELLKEIEDMCEEKWSEVEASVTLHRIMCADLRDNPELEEMIKCNEKTSKILYCEYAGMRKVYRKVKEFVEVSA